MSLKTKLTEEFDKQLKEIGKMDVGSEKYKIAIDGVSKLADRIIEIDKIEDESDRKNRQLEDDAYFKEQQLRNDKRDIIIRNAIKGAEIVGSLGLATWAFVASMNFERDGHLFSAEGSRSSLRQLMRFIK